MEGPGSPQQEIAPLDGRRLPGRSPLTVAALNHLGEGTAASAQYWGMSVHRLDWKRLEDCEVLALSSVTK